MNEKATLTYNGKTYDLPVFTGSENESSVDISKLRQQSGLITLDDSYGNTGSCISNITFIDGEQGILRYRGYPIEQLAEKSTFTETAYLIIHGELPTATQLGEFEHQLSLQAPLHDAMRHHYEGFPHNAHPMAVLSAMINALSCYEKSPMRPQDMVDFPAATASLMSKVRSIAAASYKKSIGEPFIFPRPDLGYTANFLHMMFSRPYSKFDPPAEVVHALDQIFILHADHEQNCSTSTVRMVGSSEANLYASVAAGVCALWGPLHGGANQAVIEMLTEMRAQKISAKDYVARVKADHETKLMGFGHRVYKNFDPRAKIIKSACDKVLAKMGIRDPLLDLAKELEEIALHDQFFIDRKLYPNVDFYSGIIMRAIGIPVEMFTVMFAIGRMPGWIANWHEVHANPKARIYRPRQVYNGPVKRDYAPLGKRGG